MTIGVRRLAAAMMAVLLSMLIAEPLFACAVCTGAPGDPLVEGANRGIWVLLGIVFIVQIGFVALFVTFWRRARAIRKVREQFRLVDSSFGGSR